MTIKRVNKTKDEISNDILLQQKTSEKIALVRKIFPLLKEQDSIYDAQTVLYGFSGYIKGEIQKRERAFDIKALEIDLSKEKEGKIKDGVAKLLEEFKDEKAWAFSSLLNEFADSFQKYAAIEYLKNPMDIIKEDDLIAKKNE